MIVQTLLLNIVADLELTASQAVKFILILILLAAATLNVYKAYKANTAQKKTIKIGIAAILILIILPIKRWYDIEGDLLNHPEYTTGVTINYCDEFAKGAAVEFSYEVDGVEYRNCNAYHPVPKEQIIFSGGKYAVRYSKKYPDKGRMDFKQPVP